MTTVVAIHIYPRGQVQVGTDAPHVTSMDCWCEPNTTLHVHARDGDPSPLPVVVHGDGIIACKALKEDAT